MNGDVNLFSEGGGGGCLFYSQESFSLKSGNSFTRDRRSAVVVSGDCFQIIPINTQLTTL